MKTILSQAAKAETANAEGATTIPKGSRFQVESKRGASHVDEEIVWTCWRQQEGEWKRFTRNVFWVLPVIIACLRLRFPRILFKEFGTSTQFLPFHRTLIQTALPLDGEFLQLRDCVSESAQSEQGTHRAASHFLFCCTANSTAEYCRGYSPSRNQYGLSRNSESPFQADNQELHRQHISAAINCPVPCRNKHRATAIQISIEGVRDETLVR